MSKRSNPKVVTANHLLDGDVIYLDATGTWVRFIDTAKIFDTAEDANAALDAITDDVVGAYIFDVAQTTDGPDPIHFREDFRATGPSNYRHGKQELEHV